MGKAKRAKAWMASDGFAHLSIEKVLRHETELMIRKGKINDSMIDFIFDNAEELRDILEQLLEHRKEDVR